MAHLGCQMFQAIHCICANEFSVYIRTVPLPRKATAKGKMHSNFIFIFGMCRLFVSTLLNVYHVARDCDNYLGKNIICWMANMYTVICWFVCVCVHYRCHFFFYLFMNTLHSAYWILNAKWWQFSFVFDLILFFFSLFSVIFISFHIFCLLFRCICWLWVKALSMELLIIQDYSMRTEFTASVCVYISSVCNHMQHPKCWLAQYAYNINIHIMWCLLLMNFLSTLQYRVGVWSFNFVLRPQTAMAGYPTQNSHSEQIDKQYCSK